jgi:hypothetical protein
MGMYQKPQLERFGTFRELTLLGNNGNTDGQTFMGVDGDNVFNTCTPQGSGVFCRNS